MKIIAQNVPFYSNTSDGMHCFQAAFKMMLGYFTPERTYTWQDLESMSGKEESLSTWPQQMLVSLTGLGFEVVQVDGFDGKAFIEAGESYLRETYGDEIANWQLANSNIPLEQERYTAAYAAGANIEARIPKLQEIQGYIQNGYLVMCNINSRKLNGHAGYVGHSVVLLDVDEKRQEVILHDPGPPALERRHVSIKTFEEAWAYPNESAKIYIAIRPKENL